MELTHTFTRIYCFGSETELPRHGLLPLGGGFLFILRILKMPAGQGLLRRSSIDEEVEAAE